MLISAKYKSDKIVVDHAQRIDGISRYAHDLAKDPSNGWTKDRNMRRIGSFPNLTLLEYDREHPRWLKRTQGAYGREEMQIAWKEFLKSDYAKPFLMVEKIKH